MRVPERVRAEQVERAERQTAYKYVSHAETREEFGQAYRAAATLQVAVGLRERGLDWRDG